MSERIWVVIPAAGVGRRMASADSQQPMPKQYLPLAGRSVIEYSMAPFLERADVAGIVVVLAESDVRFAELPIARSVQVRATIGGDERADSAKADVTEQPEK